MTIDRLDFIENLGLKDDMVGNFDEIMSLYEVATIPNQAELSLNSDKSKISVDLALPSDDMAAKVKGYFDQIEITNYKNKYVVETTLNDKTINLKLNKVSG